MMGSGAVAVSAHCGTWTTNGALPVSRTAGLPLASTLSVAVGPSSVRNDGTWKVPTISRHRFGSDGVSLTALMS